MIHVVSVMSSISLSQGRENKQNTNTDVSAKTDYILWHVNEMIGKTQYNSFQSVSFAREVLCQVHFFL